MVPKGNCLLSRFCLTSLWCTMCWMSWQSHQTICWRELLQLQKQTGTSRSVEDASTKVVHLTQRSGELQNSKSSCQIVPVKKEAGGEGVRAPPPLKVDLILLVRVWGGSQPGSWQADFKITMQNIYTQFLNKEVYRACVSSFPFETRNHCAIFFLLWQKLWDPCCWKVNCSHVLSCAETSLLKREHRW